MHRDVKSGRSGRYICAIFFQLVLIFGNMMQIPALSALATGAISTILSALSYQHKCWENQLSLTLFSHKDNPTSLQNMLKIIHFIAPEASAEGACIFMKVGYYGSFVIGYYGSFVIGYYVLVGGLLWR